MPYTRKKRLNQLNPDHRHSVDFQIPDPPLFLTEAASETSAKAQFLAHQNRTAGDGG